MPATWRGRRRSPRTRDAPERREDRHRVAEDRGPPRRQRLHREDRQDVPDDHVGDARACRARASRSRAITNETVCTAQHRPQHRQPEPHRQRAKAERRKAGDADLHHRPVEAPDHRQEGQQHVLRAAERELVRTTGRSVAPQVALAPEEDAHADAEHEHDRRRRPRSRSGCGSAAGPRSSCRRSRSRGSAAGRSPSARSACA